MQERASVAAFTWLRAMYAAAVNPGKPRPLSVRLNYVP